VPPVGLTYPAARQLTAADGRIWHEFYDLIADATLFGVVPAPQDWRG